MRITTTNWWERLEAQPKRDRFAQHVMEALRTSGTTRTLDYDPDQFQIDLQPTSDLR